MLEKLPLGGACQRLSIDTDRQGPTRGEGNAEPCMTGTTCCICNNRMLMGVFRAILVDRVHSRARAKAGNLVQIIFPISRYHVKL
jgi:hypothetical protein